MKYHIIATFNIDISEELAKDEWEAAKFVRSLIDFIACDTEGTYVGCVTKELHQKQQEKEHSKTSEGDN